MKRIKKLRSKRNKVEKNGMKAKKSKKNGDRIECKKETEYDEKQQRKKKSVKQTIRKTSEIRGKPNYTNRIDKKIPAK